MCVHTLTYTRVYWAWSPESNQEGGHQTRRLLGELGCCPLALFCWAGAEGTSRASVCVWIAVIEPRTWLGSVPAGCSQIQLVGVGVWYGQMAPSACHCQGTSGGKLLPGKWLTEPCAVCGLCQHEPTEPSHCLAGRPGVHIS